MKLYNVLNSQKFIGINIHVIVQQRINLQSYIGHKAYQNIFLNE